MGPEKLLTLQYSNTAMDNLNLILFIMDFPKTESQMGVTETTIQMATRILFNNENYARSVDAPAVFWILLNPQIPNLKNKVR